MKKSITLILGLCLCFALMGCDEASESNYASEPSGSGLFGLTATPQNENIISYNENTGLLYVPLLENNNIQQIITINGKKVQVNVIDELYGVSYGPKVVDCFIVHEPFVEFTPENRTRLYYAKVDLDNGKIYFCKISLRYL